MIILHGFGPIYGLADLSPFVTKVDAYLRLAGIPYRHQRYPFLAVGNAPKGKLPFIEDDGQRIADSGSIIAHLQRRFGPGPDAGLTGAGLTDADRAAGHGLRRMVEEHLYWALVQLRWRIDANWHAFMATVFGAWQDDPELAAILPQVRAGVLAQLDGQGLGRHAPGEVWDLARADVAAMAGLLGDRPHFAGPAPGSVDASAYAFLAHLQAGFDNPVADEIRAHPNLVAYCDRMALRLYGAERADKAA